MSAAGDIAGDHQGGAEISQGADEGEHHARHEPAPGERESDREKDGRLATAKQAGDVFQGGVDRFDRASGGEQKEREGGDGRGEDGPCPMKDEHDAELMFEPPAEPGASADDLEEVIAHDRGREHEGQKEETGKQAFAWKTAAGEQGCEGKAEGEHEDGGERGDAYREPEWGEVELRSGHGPVSAGVALKPCEIRSFCPWGEVRNRAKDSAASRFFVAETIPRVCTIGS